MEEKNKDNSGVLYGFLAVLYAVIQYGWAVAVTVYYREKGMLEYVSAPDGYLPLFFSNLLLSLPMAFVFIGSKIRYRRNFGEELEYVKTDRYVFTLLLTTIYTFMLPLGVVVSSSPTRGAYAWFYYIFFISFFEEFLYRGLIPTYMERSNLPKALIYILPSLFYALYQTALPFGRSGFSVDVLITTIPNIVLSIVLHYLLYAAKKWTGAMWLPIVLHAIIEFSIYLVFLQ